MNQIPLFLGDVAGSEILVIIAVVLLFFGSKSIPGIAKSLGQAMYQIRNATSELQQEIKKSGAGIKSELNIDSILKESQDQLVQPLDQMYSDVENSMHYTGKPQTPIERSNEQVRLSESATAENTQVDSENFTSADDESAKAEVLSEVKQHTEPESEPESELEQASVKSTKNIEK